MAATAAALENLRKRRPSLKINLMMAASWNEDGAQKHEDKKSGDFRL